MAKALNIDLNVNANTSLARQELSLLQNTLKQLTTASGEISRNLTTGMDLSKTIAQVTLLRTLLQSATNVDTGVLNFTKLNLSIQLANTSLLDYGRTLNSLGPTGQKAFLQLATAVSKSEIPISQTNGMLKQFGTTMKNTLRWQASSMLLHGTVNAIQKAWNYAQKLDRSLTDIQIVTKQSDAQMAKFAESANKAARALSTNTTAYTDAALIYYQLGLNDRQVKERTDVTVKMANVTGRTAEKVSNQMTAIWNNFDNGSKSLEYYADVITALGAATASSSDEIATGLSKFAAVADTVGLSYENATAALATITATTRQSADSVGNGLKTLFSRLQSLSLGQTLEDGVNLTKYTKALNTVGVSALDAAGNLRSMDSILADLGERWDSLSSAQLNALAQTVGGVRLYVTFTALMDNYDFFKDNIQIAKSAAGELLKQADVYDKSWAAARKHVQASAEAIYSDLIDDKFFTGLTNGFAGLLHLVDNLIDGIGGIKGVLLTAGTALATFNKQGTLAFILNTMNGIQTLFPSGVRKLQEERSRLLDEMTKMIWNPDNPNQYASEVEKATALGITRQIRMQELFTREQNTYSPLLMMYAQLQMADMETLNTNATNFAQQVTSLEEQRFANLSALRNFLTFDKNGANAIGELFFNTDILKNLTTGQSAGANYIKLLSSNLNNLTNLQWIALDLTSQTLRDELVQSLEELDPNIAAELRGVTSKLGWQNVINSVSTQLNTTINNALNKSFSNLKPETRERLTNYIRTDIENLGRSGFAQALYAEAERKANEQAEKGILLLPLRFTAALGMTEAISMIGGLGMSYQILKNGVGNLFNQNMPLTDRLAGASTSLLMASPILATVRKGVLNSELLKNMGLGSLLGAGLTNYGNLLRVSAARQDILKPGSAVVASYNAAANKDQFINNYILSNNIPENSALRMGRVFQTLNQPFTKLAGNKTIQNIGMKLGIGGKDATAAVAGQGMAGGIKALAIIGAIIAAKEGIEFIAQSIESPAEKIERLEKSADAAKNRLNETKEAYSTLMTLSTLHSQALQQLNELEKGTVEYKQAVLEANNTAMDIITSNNLTPSDYSTENGIITINEKALLDALEKAYNEEVKANQRANAAKATLNNARALLGFDKMNTYGAWRGMWAAGELAKTIEAYGVEHYNDVDAFTELASELNMGSGAAVAQAIIDGTLQELLMISSGAAALNLLLLTDIATQMSSTGKINDLLQLAIEQLSTSADFAETLTNAGQKGLDSAAVASRSLGHFRNLYEQTFGTLALNDFITSSEYALADRHTKQVMLALAVAALRETDAATKLLQELFKAIEDAGFNAYLFENYKSLDYQSLLSLFVEGASSGNKSVQGLAALIADDYAKSVGDFWYYGASIGADATALNGYKNFSLQDIENIVSVSLQFGDEFGKATASTLFSALGSKTTSALLNKALKNIDITGDTILDMINIKDASPKIGKQLSDDLYDAMLEDLGGGELGLFKGLYESDTFSEALDDLKKTFEKTGDITASNILALSESNKALSAYLDTTSINAAGLANTFESIFGGGLGLNLITENYIKAQSTASGQEAIAAETTAWMDEFDKGTSIDTVGSFYKTLEGYIYKSIKAGNFLDEPLINSIRQLFGEDAVDEWRVLASKATQMGIKPGGLWLWNESSFADRLGVIKEIYSTGNLLPLWKDFLASEDTAGLGDFISYANGAVRVNGVHSFVEQYDSVENLIQKILGTEWGLKYGEDNVRNMVNEAFGEYGKNADVSLAFQGSEAALGLEELFNGNTPVEASAVREYLKQNQTVIANSSDWERERIANALGISLSDLNNAIIPSTDNEVASLKVDQIIKTATLKNDKLVNLGENFFDNDGNVISEENIGIAYARNNNGKSFGDYLFSEGAVLGTSLRQEDLTDELFVEAFNQLAKDPNYLYKLLGAARGAGVAGAFDNDASLTKTGFEYDPIFGLSSYQYTRPEDIAWARKYVQENGINLSGYLTDDAKQAISTSSLYLDVDTAIQKLTDLGLNEADALSQLNEYFGTEEGKALLTLQMWSLSANEGKGGWITATMNNQDYQKWLETHGGEATAENFYEWAGGAADAQYAALQKKQSQIDIANAIKLAQGDYDNLLPDVLDAMGNIIDNQETGLEYDAATETWQNKKDVDTSGSKNLVEDENGNLVEAPEETPKETENPPEEVNPPTDANSLETAPLPTPTSTPEKAWTGLTPEQLHERAVQEAVEKLLIEAEALKIFDELTGKEAASGQNNYPGFARGNAEPMIDRAHYTGLAVGGELGDELVVNGNQAALVGHRDTFYIGPDTLVYTAGQTRRLLEEHPMLKESLPHYAGGLNIGNGKPGFRIVIDDPRTDKVSDALGITKSPPTPSTPKEDTNSDTYPGGYGSGVSHSRGSGGKKEDSDKWKDSWEPYHEISREVQRLTTDVENLNTEMERAFGVEKIQKMDEELELLDLRLLQETDYIAEAEKYIAEYAEYLPDGTEVVDGVILNYDELLEKYLKDIYQAQEDRDKDKLEKLQREWQKIQQYEQHTDKLEERRLEQLNLLYQKADLILLQLLYSIDLVNNSLDESKDLIDYMLGHMDTDMFKMAESIALIGDATDITIQKMELAKQSIQDYEDLLGTEYANDEELVNNILQERNNLLKLNQELDKQRDVVIKKLTYTIQEFNNELKKATKLLTNYNTLIKNYTDLSELMGLSTINNTEQIDKLNDALKNNMGLNIQATKSQLEANQEALAQMEAEFEANPWMREAYDDVYQKLIEEGQGLSVTLSNNLQSMLNFIVKEFETELDRALTSFQDQITKGFGTWDELTSAANSLKGAQDVNTKAYDRVYQLNTLIRDMDSYMNDMTSAKNHNSILKFQELIKKLKADNTDLSQEELDVLRAQFELMLALFDLEDAQNAKNQVRLQRDMNGNWGYVYTADEDAMAEAQLNVDDKLKAYLDAVTALLQVQGEYMGTVAELEIQEQELRNELNQLGHTDEDEERRALLLKLIAAIEEQLDMYKNNLLRMLDTLNEAVDSGHGYIQEIWDESNELFNASLGALPQMMLEGIATTEEFFDVLSNAEIAFVDRTTAAKDAYMEQYEEWAPYLEQFNNGLGDMAEQSLKAVTNLDALNELYLQEFTDAMEAAVKWEQEYGKQMENVVKLNLIFIDLLDQMINGLRGLDSMDYSVSFRRVTDDSEVSAMTSMDSGGYTGAWGTSGKIAMLHEKEQVFNAQDTLNLLTAALILRTIDASANSMAIGLNNMITPKINGVTQQVDLTVNISASFPNAVNHFEIEEAFNNLTNKAVQFANRKNA